MYITCNVLYTYIWCISLSHEHRSIESTCSFDLFPSSFLLLLLLLLLLRELLRSWLLSYRVYLRVIHWIECRSFHFMFSMSPAPLSPTLPPRQLSSWSLEKPIWLVSWQWASSVMTLLDSPSSSSFPSYSFSSSSSSSSLSSRYLCDLLPPQRTTSQWRYQPRETPLSFSQSTPAGE